MLPLSQRGVLSLHHIRHRNMDHPPRLERGLTESKSVVLPIRRQVKNLSFFLKSGTFQFTFNLGIVYRRNEKL
jgi:hypothetical protein